MDYQPPAPATSVIRLKRLIAHAIHNTKIHSLFACERSVPWRILTYHRVIPSEKYAFPQLAGMYVTPETFAMQMKYLAAEADVVPLAFLVESLAENRPLPPRTVVLTFDDGWKDNFDYAFPILRAHNLPATIFLPTAFVGLQGAIEARTIGVREDNEFIAYVKSLPGAGANERLFVNWDEVKTMAGEHISFGSHSHRHEKATILAAPQLKDDITTSYRSLSANGVTPLPVFCYPGGYYNETTQAVLREIGIQFALSTESYSQRSLTPQLLGRVSIHEDISNTVAMFACRIWANGLF